VIRPGKGWDCNVARLACVVYVPPVFTAFYDGRTGKGMFTKTDRHRSRTDPRVLRKHEWEGPGSDFPVGTGSLRYMDIVPLGDCFFYFYEQ